MSETPSLPNFCVERKIGTGSYATVWLARRIKATHSTQHVAIKAISREKLTQKLQENLESEMAILRDFRHLNLVGLVEIIKRPSHIYIVLEFLEGGDLQKLIRSRKRLGEATAQRFMRDLASGLEFLWSKNLIHRDLKPQNLLLTTDDERTAVLKIADFGFARHLETAALAETLCGSPLYMAPEILSFKRYDAKADLWSVGAVLFEMVAGEPPFKGRDHRELLENIQKRTLRLPADVTISVDCLKLLQALLKRNPISRISFEDFLASPFVAKQPRSPLDDDDDDEEEHRHDSILNDDEEEEELPPPPPTEDLLDDSLFSSPQVSSGGRRNSGVRQSSSKDLTSCLEEDDEDEEEQPFVDAPSSARRASPTPTTPTSSCCSSSPPQPPSLMTIMSKTGGCLSSTPSPSSSSSSSSSMMNMSSKAPIIQNNEMATTNSGNNLGSDEFVVVEHYAFGARSAQSFTSSNGTAAITSNKRALVEASVDESLCCALVLARVADSLVRQDSRAASSALAVYVLALRSAQAAICAARGEDVDDDEEDVQQDHRLKLLGSQYVVLLQRAEDARQRVLLDNGGQPPAPESACARAEDVVYRYSTRAAKLGAARESLGDLKNAQRKYAEASRCLKALASIATESSRDNKLEKLVNKALDRLRAVPAS